MGGRIWRIPCSRTPAHTSYGLYRLLGQMSKTCMCVWHTDTQSIQAWYDQKPSQYLKPVYFSSYSPILYNSSLKEKFLRRFYFFSVYPGPLARAYKIIKEGLIKGKLYTEPEFFSVQLAPPVFSVHDIVHCASSNTKGFVQKRELSFLHCTITQPPQISSTDNAVESCFIENCPENGK